MKSFLRYAVGVIAALLVIYFWPNHRQIKEIHLAGSSVYQNPEHFRELGQDQIEFDAISPDGVHRHVHWAGSYWLEYK